jgi:hypothetical protein
LYISERAKDIDSHSNSMIMQAELVDFKVVDRDGLLTTPYN